MSPSASRLLFDVAPVAALPSVRPVSKQDQTSLASSAEPHWSSANFIALEIELLQVLSSETLAIQGSLQADSQARFSHWQVNIKIN